MGMNEDMKLQIPLTIERQLENYSRCEGHTDRHETLWHAWYQNKRWISQLLQITLSSFPTYSKHDESHALSVLNNIEMLLGQEGIAQLTASDCFVLLHTVYIHDIGMCITQQDRKEIVENENFIDMIEELEKSGDETTKKAIKTLKCTEYEAISGSDEEKVSYLKTLYRAKLDVYYAMLELLSAYRRTEHGEKSAQRLYEWTLKPEKLGAGFSMAGVPLRIFLAIAKSAQMHTCGSFDEIERLPQKDGGYASDYYHPRFVSVLLMLGDLLDMDNDRFHPMVMELVEEFSETSRMHYDKHKSIRKLNISPDVIEIEADCPNQNALRLVRRECDMLVDILRHAGYKWTSICPDGFKGSLPSLKEVNLFLNGQKIPEELVTAQFNISQNKAFSILEGSNLYEERFVFLREFLQNAVDASKMQYWLDYMGTAEYYYEHEMVEKKTPEQMNQELPLDKYPVEIEMKLQKRDDKEGLKDVRLEDIQQIEKGKPGKFEYGILVSVKDFGTGIDKESITAISKVGSSRIKDKRIIQKMPQWLRPTAEFGVGLQSAFLLADSFKCYTHTRSGERYEITFNSGSSLSYEGYINVIPYDYLDGIYEAYGTCFEMFVPLKKKFLHSESIYTWSGSDPFAEDYENTRILRHASELISQMALYLDKLLGEVLFPVVLSVDSQNLLKLELNTKRENTIHKMHYAKKASIAIAKEKSWMKPWIFRKNEDIFLKGSTENTIYALEYDTARLYIWAKDISVFCAVSGANLMRRAVEQRERRNQNNVPSGIMIYYKGIEFQRRCVEEEIDIFEYIDIKGNLKRSFMNINRRGFTVEGETYFEEEIYKKLQGLVREVLQYINKQQNNQKLIQNITAKIRKYSEQKKSDLSNEESHNQISSLANQLLSLTFLSYLAVKDYNDELSNLGKNCGKEKWKEEQCVWQETLQQIVEVLYRKENRIALAAIRESSILFGIQTYECGEVCTEKTLTILDLFLNQKHYGILQVRDNIFGEWTDYIVSIQTEKYELFEQRMLSESVDLGNVKAVDNQIEVWSQGLFERMKNIGVSVPNNKRYQQQFLVTWLVQNIPVIGVFSDESGNRRFNVLGNCVYPYVYTNNHHKVLILERILETAKKQGINRFSTFAWQGRQYMAVSKLPFSCFFCKRGYLNKASLYKVVFPIERSTLLMMQEIMDNIKKTDIVKNVTMLAYLLDITNFLNELLRKEPKDEREKQIQDVVKEKMERGKGNSFSVNMKEFFEDCMMGMMERNMEIEKNVKTSLPQNYFQRLVGYECKWYNSLLDLLEIFLRVDDENGQKEDELQKEIDEWKNKESVKFIFAGWRFITHDIRNEIASYLQIPKLKEEYWKIYKEEPKLQSTNERILEYIVKHGRYPMSKKQLEKCFATYVEEIFELAEELEKARILNSLDCIIK